MNEQAVSIENIGGGALKELFAYEWEKVMKNIADPNTKADGARIITIKVKVIADKARRGATTQVKVTSDLPGIQPHESNIYFKRRGNDLVAFPDDPGQGSLELEEVPEGGASVIVPIAQRQ